MIVSQWTYERHESIREICGERCTDAQVNGLRYREEHTRAKKKTQMRVHMHLRTHTQYTLPPPPGLSQGTETGRRCAHLQASAAHPFPSAKQHDKIFNFV